jgi:drug/metabolite transporter (DMT)-like permease
MVWILYALLAPFFWALTNHLDKFIVDKKVNGISNYMFFSTLGSIILVIGVMVFKGFIILPLNIMLPSLLLGVLAFLGMAAYGKALQKDDASTVAPLFQFVPAITLILGFLFLGESLTGMALMGFLVVFVGGWIITVETTFKKIFKVRKSFWLMLLSSSLYALLFVIGRSLYSTNSLIDIYTYELIGFILSGWALLLIPSSRKKIVEAFKKATKATYGFFLLNDIIDLSGSVFFRLALAIAPVALVSAMIGVQPFFVLGIGLFLTLFFPKIIKETISKEILIRKSVGIVIIFVGLLMITL